MNPVSPKASLARPVNEASIPAHLNCTACSKLLVNGCQSDHGFRLCQHCVDSLHPTRLVLCPGTSNADDDDCDRMVSQATFKPDLSIRREISKLLVMCPNADQGCTVQLTWKNVDTHLISECDFEVSQCQLCSKYIVLKKLHSCHRDLLATDCCPNFYAHCPQCCDMSKLLNCETISEHLNTACPVQSTACKYASFGCSEVQPRSQLQRHYKKNNDKHLEQTVRQLEAKIQEICQGSKARLYVAEADGSERDKKLKQMSREVAQLYTRLKSVKAEAERVREENREKDKKLDTMQQQLCTLLSRVDVLEATKVKESRNIAVRNELRKQRKNKLYKKPSLKEKLKIWLITSAALTQLVVLVLYVA